MMCIYFSFLLPLLLVGAGFAAAAGGTTERPIVGVLTVPLASGGCVTGAGVLTAEAAAATSCFHSVYVKWLESAGARVVPLRYDLPDGELLRLAASVNGILFTGGDTPIIHTHSQYMHAAGLLLNQTIAAQDHFPLWGTCMGIQTLSILVAGTSDVLESGIFTGVDPQMMPLNMTPAAKTSRLLGAATTPPSILEILGQEHVTTNLHHDGVDPATFETNARLRAFYDVLSTNVDSSGHSFVSTIEAKSVPVYAVQWHPERPQFDWTYGGRLNHGADAIEAMSWVSRFFVGEARKNGRAFANKLEEEQALIYNYAPQTGRSSYQAYLFAQLEL
jgi:gamma-glutamyl hydrolase